MTAVAETLVFEDEARIQIDTLVDEQFARIQPRLQNYLADPRRQYSSREGAILTLNSTSGVGQSIQDDEATRAFVSVVPINPESRSYAARKLLGGLITRFGLQEPFTQLFGAVEGGELGIVGGELDLSIRREEHPKNWNAHSLGDPWFWGDPNGEYDTLGLRRHVSAILKLDVTDPETSEPVSRIEARAKAAARFDRGETLFTAGLYLGEVSCNGVEIAAQSETVRGPAELRDVSILAQTFHATKDLRPRVASVKAVEQWMQFCALLEAGKHDEARKLYGRS